MKLNLLSGYKVVSPSPGTSVTPMCMSWMADSRWVLASLNCPFFNFLHSFLIHLCHFSMQARLRLVSALSSLSTSMSFITFVKWKTILKIIQVDRQCFLLIKTALKFIPLHLCCWWLFTLIGALHINRLQSLDTRCKGSSAGFFQVGAGFHWLLNASLLGLFFFLEMLIQLESSNPQCRSVWSLHVALSLSLLRRSR